MAPSSIANIRYTTKHLPPDVVTGRSFVFHSLNEPFRSVQSSGGNDYTPAIELVTVVDHNGSHKAPPSPKDSPNEFGECQVTNIRDRYLIIHSESLTKTIRETVNFFPGQVLTGSNLVIHEPFACLMHHMVDLETVNDTEAHSPESNHLKALLEFLRPLYEQQFVPAKNRLSASEPTVRFEDLWVLMKPSSPAYMKFNGQWLGCVVDVIRELPPDTAKSRHPTCSIDCWFLQVDWPSDRLGCAMNTVFLDHFDGEKLITDLPIIPADTFDALDCGARKKQFEARGSKICDILWGGSKYMYYNGECLDRSEKRFKGRILIGGTAWKQSYPAHEWTVNWISPAEVMRKTPENDLAKIETMLDPTIHHRSLLVQNHLFLISPCLSAFRIPENEWVPITIENVGPLEVPEYSSLPLLEERDVVSVTSLVNSVDRDTATKTSENGSGMTILFCGEPGVGKSYTIDYIAMITSRPLLAINQSDIIFNPGVEGYLLDWFAFADKWNAIVVIDNIDPLIAMGLENDSTQASFAKSLDRFKGVLFLTCTSSERFSRRLLSRIQLNIKFSPLNNHARKFMWRALEDKLQQEVGQLQLTRMARDFLHASETQVDWNGHEINHCFRTAIALATAQAKLMCQDWESSISVEVEHFKEAMNLVFRVRRHADGSAPVWDSSYNPFTPQTLKEDRPSQQVQYANLPQASTAYTDSHSEDDPALSEPAPLPLRSDSTLCIPSLNCVEWLAFQAAGRNRDLFRKTKFYAIDVLRGEPQIILKATKRSPRRWEKLTDKSVSTGSEMPDAANQTEPTEDASLPGEAPLPERIRINSPAIVKAFSEIHGDQSFPGPFLIFRPYLSLLYYERDFRDWITKQEKIMKDEPSYNTSMRESDQNFDEAAAQRNLVSEGLQEMKCLISFIDDIKQKQEYLASSACKTVAFSDLPLLFSPGDLVTLNGKQAYQITRVDNPRHEVKKPDENDSKLWKDSSKAEFVDHPIRIYIVCVDFDGYLIGPALHSFFFPKFTGRKEVTSLSVYPLRFAQDDGLRDKLIERGKTFVKLASIKHMHYTGLTLFPVEELDSQVVIDCEELANRNPTLKPRLRSDQPTGGVNSAEGDPTKYAQYSQWSPTEGRYISVPQPVTNNSPPRCVGECCGTEPVHHEEYVADRREKENRASQLGDSTSVRASIAMSPRPFADLNEQRTPTDDEYLIMSDRVWGFAMRNRRWYALDMANLSDVSVPGEGEGFDQLVLPEGHGDMVKSMIKQHFREKKLSSKRLGPSDIVRGKGRGLIMLLHGVPGVGKTSTAECVADLFHRPLLQITSGDLGTTAKEVEDTLNNNFNLASRWDSVLLIDEADVFLGERTKEDFVRNSLVAVFLRMMEYYSGILFLTTNRVGVFDEAFTSRIHISLYYPPLDRESTRKIFEKNWERIQASYDKNGRSIDVKVSEITEFALDYFDNNKEGRWNGRQIRNAFQSAVALAELDASGTDDLFSEVDHGQPVILGKKSFDTVAKVYKSFLTYLKQVYGADYARRARENLWRFDAFGAPRIPNALTTRLAVADPAPPPRGPEPPRAGQYQQPWYDYREPSHPYPPQQNYPQRYSYDYSSQRPPSGPPPEQQAYREAPRGMGPQPSEYYPPPARPDDPRSEGYRDDRGFSQSAPHPEWAGRGGEGAGSGGYHAPTRHDPQHSQAQYPSGSGHLSPFQGHDR